MKSIDELRNELKRLPNGYISKKTINNRQYYYLQYFDNGRLKSKFVPLSQLDNVTRQITRRKEIEKQIKERENQGNNLVRLSDNHRNFNGYLMSGNDVVASFKDGVLYYIDEQRVPLYIKRLHDIRGFLKRRVFDDSRVNTRLLKKALFIKESDPEYISLLVHGASITDNYWFKVKGSRTKYEDIIFSDYYADTALKGIVYPLSKPKLSPELTLTGSYEKCWKNISSQWWLYKKENDNELFSEMFSSRIAKALGIPTVEYLYDDGYIKCLNFAEFYNFEPMSSLCDNDDNYDKVFNILYDIDKQIAFDYLKLMMFDVIVNNVDRHNENYGLLRDKKTGAIISLSPNFDNNISLLGIDPNLNNQDGFVSVFKKFLSNNENAYRLYKNIHLPLLDENIIRNIIKDIPIKINKNDEIVSYVFHRYYKVINL